MGDYDGDLVNDYQMANGSVFTDCSAHGRSLWLPPSVTAKHKVMRCCKLISAPVEITEVHSNRVFDIDGSPALDIIFQTPEADTSEA